MSRRIRVGCCGFRKARATYYAHFDLVEIQQTFYHPPQPSTVQRWRQEAPEGFEFTLKAWQLITHSPSSPTYRRLRLTIPEEATGHYGAFRPTDEVFAAWETTRQQAEALEARIVVFQCPASFTPTPEHQANMRAFFSQIERGDLRFAWEPRGRWSDDQIRTLCQELDLIHCVDPFDRLPVYGDLLYFRLHGRGGYRYTYTDEDLARLNDWCQAAREVYVLFNNVSMWEDALRFRERIG